MIARLVRCCRRKQSAGETANTARDNAGRNIIASLLACTGCVALAWAIAGGTAIAAAADQPASDASQSGPQSSEDLSKSLPDPPEAIAKLIGDGNVVFDFFDETEQTHRYPGETTFDFRYQYRCRTRHQVIDHPHVPVGSRSTDPAATDPASQSAPPVSGRALKVSIDYDEISLTISHRIRLPSRLVGPAFYGNPLVLHEFDHVAISADQRLRPLLTRMLTERNAVVIVPLSDEQFTAGDRRQYTTLAQTAAREETAKVFEQFVSLVKIRYKELDQITRHGIKPLEPEDRQRLLRF